MQLHDPFQSSPIIPVGSSSRPRVALPVAGVENLGQPPRKKPKVKNQPITPKTFPLRTQILLALPNARNAQKLKSEGHEHSYLLPEKLPAATLRMTKTMHVGGYSKIRYARDEQNQEFAIMVSHPEGNGPNAKRMVKPTRLEDLARTDKLLQKMDHPLRSLDMWVDEKCRIYSRTKLMGPDIHATLLDRTTTAPYGFDTRWVNGFLYLMRGMAQALVPLHKQNVVHFDIKPANYLLTRGDAPEIVLADFGMHRPAGVQSPGLRRGTWRFMAPEVVLTHWPHALDGSSDIFSLGMTFLEMLNRSHFSQLLRRGQATREEETRDYKIFFQNLTAHQRESFDCQDLFRSSESDPFNSLHSMLYIIDPALAQLIMTDMLHETPTARPSAEEVTARLHCLATSQEMTEGQQLIARQVAYQQAKQPQRNPASLLDALGNIPVRPALNSKKTTDNQAPFAADSMHRKMAPLPVRAANKAVLTPAG